MSNKDKPTEIKLLRVDTSTSQLVPFEESLDKGEDDAGGTHWWDDESTRVKFEDPFKNYELMSDLAKHHQHYAEIVQKASEPDPEQQSQLSNNFGMEHQSEFLPHPLLAGKPYFNGMDPKATALPSETMLTESPEYNNARNELKLQKALKNDKKMQNSNDKGFSPRPDGF